MDLSEIISLVTIRDYILKNIENPKLDRATIYEFNNMVILIDQKLVTMLKSNEFKQYIDYSSVGKALAQTHKITHGVFDEANEKKKSEKSKL